MIIVVGPVKDRLFPVGNNRRSVVKLLRAGVLSDSLGSLRDGMLGQLSGKEKPDSSLDLPGGDGGPLVVVSQTGSLSNTLKDVIDKRVHDAHGLAGDTSVGVLLLQHLVDVDSIGLLPSQLLFLLISLNHCFLGLAGFFGSFS